MAGVAHSYEQLEDEVLHLSEQERSRLASRLLQSLEEDDFEVTSEWRAELKRRVDDFESGRAKSIPAAEVWKRLNERFGTNL